MPVRSSCLLAFLLLALVAAAGAYAQTAPEPTPTPTATPAPWPISLPAGVYFSAEGSVKVPVEYE